jgi:hypothetical protein
MTRSVDEAEDLVRETFLRAWRAQEGVEIRPSSSCRAPPGRSRCLTWPVPLTKGGRIAVFADTAVVTRFVEGRKS